jgi:predicted thioredoxin/glutaredoxin
VNKDVALKIGLWAVPVLFGMGALYQTVLGSSVDVVEVESRLEAHEDLKAHPVTESQIDTILTEQRAVRAEQIEQGENLAAICQATGANCK